jgi:hypothetical protein
MFKKTETVVETGIVLVAAAYAVKGLYNLSTDLIDWSKNRFLKK